MDTSAAQNAAHSLPSATDSWVYLFSKFTHEAMLFEALAICLGIFGYAIFYLIRKRKYGVAGKEISSSLVKVYLAQLVADAEEMRTQLFGLLGKGEASAKLIAGLQLQAETLGQAPIAPAAAGSGATAAGAAMPAPQIVQDPQLTEKLKELEKKLQEQANALDSVLNEKMKLEEELASVKTDSKGAPSPGGPDKTGALNERVKQLESQLAEYAIIEDDLANLKRLQKENKALRQQLADAGPAGPRTEPAPSPAKPDPVTDNPIATEEVKRAAPNSEPAPDFEALVDVVEKNLADAPKSETIDPNTAPEAPDFKLESGPVAEKKPDEKSEEQLQADFEKMLNS